MKIYALTAAGLVAALLGGTGYLILAGGPGDELAQCRGSTVASGKAAIGGPFELVSETGATVTEADVLAQPSLIYFGYTFCPDVCPLDNYRNAEAADLLNDRGYSIQPVFITVDPDRDTPEVMAEFTDAMHPDMLGLSGSADQIARAAQAYKAYYRKQDAEDEYYLVDHSTLTYFMLPDMGFVDFFRRDATPEQMADTVACYLDATGLGGV